MSTDLTSVQTWANATAASQYLQFALRTTAVSVTAAHGDWVLAGAGTTITMPSASSNLFVMIQADGTVTSSSPVTVSSSGNMFGLGLNAASSFLLGTPFAHVILAGAGTNWSVVSGQQDSGWVALALKTNINSGGPTYYTPSCRLLGNTVYLSGQAQNNTGGTINASTASWATVPAGYRPSNTTAFGMLTINGSGVASCGGGVDTSGNITTANAISNNGGLYLDNSFYRLS